MTESPSDAIIAEETRHLTSDTFQHWLNHDFLSPQWWFLVALFLLPWVLWWILLRKEHAREILLVGTIIAIITITLDEAGYGLSFWYYQKLLIPLFPRQTALDYSAIPVGYMLLYQYCRTWKNYMIAAVILASLAGFVLEPLFVRCEFYDLLRWKYYYSSPIYIAMAVFVKALVGWLATTESRARRK
jgi:hypothetical protein